MVVVIMHEWVVHIKINVYMGIVQCFFFKNQIYSPDSFSYICYCFHSSVKSSSRGHHSSRHFYHERDIFDMG